MSAVPEVETERLLLRGWRDEDTDPWGELCADAEVMRPLGRAGGISLGDAWREMAMLAGHWTLKGFGHWVLELRATGELVGRAGLYQPPDWPGLEMGWTVARPHWGNGYAGEAARATMEWAQAELGAGVRQGEGPDPSPGVRVRPPGGVSAPAGLRGRLP